jgi:hypothetical protein
VAVTQPSEIAFFNVTTIVAKNKDSATVALFCDERTDIVERRHFSSGNAFYRSAELSKLLIQ